MNENLNVSNVINVYRDFLISNWSILEFIPKSLSGGIPNMERLNIWLEANWEIIVEYEICEPGEYLSHYGNGADYIDGASRILNPEATPTHFVKCSSDGKNIFDFLSKKEVIVNNYKFDKFVSKYNEKFYIMDRPFDYVLLTDKNENEVMVDYNLVIFNKVKI